MRSLLLLKSLWTSLVVVEHVIVIEVIIEIVVEDIVEVVLLLKLLLTSLCIDVSRNFSIVSQNVYRIVHNHSYFSYNFLSNAEGLRRKARND